MALFKNFTCLLSIGHVLIILNNAKDEGFNFLNVIFASDIIYISSLLVILGQQYLFTYTYPQ